VHSHVRIDAVISKECIDYTGGRIKNFAIIPVAQQCEISLNLKATKIVIEGKFKSKFKHGIFQ